MSNTVNGKDDLMLCLTDFIDLPNILNLMAATRFKQVGTGTVKYWECCGMPQKSPKNQSGVYDR